MTLVAALSIFATACLAGWYAVRLASPAAYAPLQAVISAISAIIVVGALVVGAEAMDGDAKRLGLLAVMLASAAIVGGGVGARRMLSTSRKPDA